LEKRKTSFALSSPDQFNRFHTGQTWLEYLKRNAICVILEKETSFFKDIEEDMAYWDEVRPVIFYTSTGRRVVLKLEDDDLKLEDDDLKLEDDEDIDF